MHNPALNNNDKINPTNQTPKNQCGLKKKQKERIRYIKAMEEEPSIMLELV